MEWIKASRYKLLSDTSQDIAHRAGLFPINDVLLPFMNDQSKVISIRGGRGGGKSNTIALRLIEECRTEAYFKCYYGRKVLERVRGSQHAELIKAIKQLKVEHEFHFSEQANGTLIIIHNRTLNGFYPFGADNPQSMKSISDPTHIWGDEFDQFEETDFKAIFPTLRTIRGKNVFIFSFNSYEIDKSHWLVKFFYPEYYDGDDKPDFDALEGISISKYLINFSDNYFIDQKEYQKALMLASGGDADKYEGLAKGEWGAQVNDKPWLFAFQRKKHVSLVELKARKDQILYLSFDFNRNPHACTVFQWNQEEEVVYILKVYKIENVGTEGICERILKDYPGFLYMVTGDYAGNTPSSIFKEHVTNYTVIKRMLNLTEGQLKLAPNPPLKDNQTLVNMIFFSYKILICPINARPAISDAEQVKMLPDGTIDKSNRKDPAKQADVLDTIRYFFNMFFSWFIKK